MVAAADRTAQEAGLRSGMVVARARALVPGLMVRPADPEGDLASLKRLALWLLQRVSPVVAVDPPDGIVIDSSGADHLHGGEAALLEGLVARLTHSGLAARAAVADTWGAAHALARYRADPVSIAPPGEVVAHLAPLPLAALRLPEGVVSGLRSLGFVRIDDLIGQPRAPLTRRFGPEPVLRLDQALGLAAEPIDPIRYEEQVTARRVFAEPIGAAETIARYVGRLATDLSARLEERGLGARRLDLLCQRVDSQAQVLRVGLARPQRDAAHLTRLLGAKIEEIDPGFGIEAMVLTASQVEPLEARQATNTLAGVQVPDLSGLVDTLINRVGTGRVYRLAPVASDVPERSVCRISALVENAAAASSHPGTSPGSVHPAPGLALSSALSDHATAAWPSNWPRPARLLLRPEPVTTMALLPDHAPAWFRWRGLRHIVRRADGPERIFGEWWAREAERTAVRDYFRVEDEAGARFWIFRAGDGEDAATGPQRWFLHGLFG